MEERGEIETLAVLYEESCDRGDFIDCNYLGVLESQRGNKYEAAYFYKKACDGESFVGCVNLGFLEEKRGNYSEAAALYAKVCDNRQGNIGCSYLEFLERRIGESALVDFNKG